MSLKYLPVIFRNRQEQNRDVICVVSGDRGDGKTNFIMYAGGLYVKMFGLKCRDCGEEWIYTGKCITHINNEIHVKQNPNLFEPCIYCESKNVGPTIFFNFKKYMGYDNEEVMHRIFNLPRYSPILADEVVRWGFSQDFAKSESKDIKKMFVQNRTKNFIVFMNIPEFINIDSKYRDMAHYWVRLIKRDDTHALAIMLRKDKSEVPDKWHLKEFQKLFKFYSEEEDMPTLYRKCRRLIGKHPCGYASFYVKPVNAKMYARYEIYRNSKVFDQKKINEELNTSQKDYAKFCIYNLKSNFKRIKELSSRTGGMTYKIMERFIFFNPVDHRKILTAATIGKWNDEIEQTIARTKQKKDKKQELQP